jgi:hypothetical protein
MECELLYPVVRNVDPGNRIFPADRIVFEPNYKNVSAHICPPSRHNTVFIAVRDHAGTIVFNRRLEKQSTAKSKRNPNFTISENFEIAHGSTKDLFPLKVFHKTDGDNTKLHAVSLPVAHITALIVKHWTTPKL